MAKTGYDFYLDKCLLPVAPSKLTIKINNKNDTLTLINEGEINILKKAGLTDVEFECDIPQVRQPYAVYPSGFKGASYFLNYFEQLKTDKKPFQFIVCRQSPNGKKFFNTNIKVTLEDYKTKLRTIEPNGYELTDLSKQKDMETRLAEIEKRISEMKINAQNEKEKREQLLNQKQQLGFSPNQDVKEVQNIGEEELIEEQAVGIKR